VLLEDDEDAMLVIVIVIVNANSETPKQTLYHETGFKLGGNF